MLRSVNQRVVFVVLESTLRNEQFWGVLKEKQEFSLPARNGFFLGEKCNCFGSKFRAQLFSIKKKSRKHRN